MRLTTTFKPRRGLGNLIGHLKKLDTSVAEWGVYKESGVHTDSGLDYTYLMGIHELGYGQKKRPALGISAIKYKEEYLKLVAKGLERYISTTASNRHSSQSRVLKPVAVHGQKRAKGVFGDSSLLVSNALSVILAKGKNSPLVNFGDLRSKVKNKVAKKEKR